MTRTINQAVAITGMGMVTAQGVGVEPSWRGIVDGGGTTPYSPGLGRDPASHSPGLGRDPASHSPGLARDNAANLNQPIPSNQKTGNPGPQYDRFAGDAEVLRPWSEIAANHPLARVKVAQCPELPRPGDLPPRLWRALSRTQQLACVAADEALSQAGLPRQSLGDGAALFLATTTCGMDVNERFYAQYRQKNTTPDVNLLRRILPGEIAELLRRRHGIQAAGARNVCLSTCVGSAMAIASAMDAINLGECDLAVAGGSEALCRVVLSGFHALKVTAPDGCRPFDVRRPGMTVGEGSGILVLENVRHARQRGARILGFLRGCGITCDAHHLTAPEPSGKYAAAAMRDALARSGLHAADIGYLNAHGTGTQANDAMEAAAIEAVFPGTVPPVSSTKRLTGHTFGAAGAVEAIFCMQAIREGILPPNAGAVEADTTLWKRGDPVARQPMRREITAAMSTNFAFGGNNTALVFAREAGNEQAPRNNAPMCPPSPAHACGVAPASPTSKPSTHPAPIPQPKLSVCGAGIVTDGYPNVQDLARSLGVPTNGALAQAHVLDAATADNLPAEDALPRLAMGALHQALAMAGPGDAGRLGLLVVTAWGMIDATSAYLESLLEAAGRHASPRHFARSVYSTAASLLAIHFKIHGPCETLAFDAAEDPVPGALSQAWRLLAAGRCKRVAIVWAEQGGALARDLAHLAAEKLHRQEYQRYVGQELGWGAVALVVAETGTEGMLGAVVANGEARGSTRPTLRGNPFAMDGAVAYLAELLAPR